MAGFIDRIIRRCGGSRVLALLVALNLLTGVALLVASLFAGAAGSGTHEMWRWLALSADPADLLRHPWTVLTYMVTQFSVLHLLFNVLWLYWFGRLMLLHEGERGVLADYIGGGLAGAVCYIAVSVTGVAPQGAYLCGASASLLAMMGTVAVADRGREVRLLLFGVVRLRWFALICILLTFLGAGGGSAGGPVAHLGGLAFGVVYGLLGTRHTLRTRAGHGTRTRKRRAERNMTRNAGAVAKAAANRLGDHRRLDELLDKIRVSGYEALSEREKEELNAISRRIK